MAKGKGMTEELNWQRPGAGRRRGITGQEGGWKIKGWRNWQSQERGGEGEERKEGGGRRDGNGDRFGLCVFNGETGSANQQIRATHKVGTGRWVNILTLSPRGGQWQW